MRDNEGRFPGKLLKLLSSWEQNCASISRRTDVSLIRLHGNTHTHNYACRAATHFSSLTCKRQRLQANVTLDSITNQVLLQMQWQEVQERTATRSSCLLSHQQEVSGCHCPADQAGTNLIGSDPLEHDRQKVCSLFIRFTQVGHFSGSLPRGIKRMLITCIKK